MREKCLLIVDDSATVRTALRQLFECSGWEICGEAENGREAIEKAQYLHPNVIILDLSMPVMNGLDAARVLREVLPETPLIMFTSYAGSAVEHEAREAGVTAFISKDEAAAASTLVSTVQKLVA